MVSSWFWNSNGFWDCIIEVDRNLKKRCVGYEDHQGWHGKNGGVKCIKCGYYESQIKGGIGFK